MLRHRAQPVRVPALAQQRLRPRLDGGDDLDLRLAHHADGPAVRRDPGPGCRRVRGRAPALASTCSPRCCSASSSGAWVDRLRRRPVLIWADLGRAVLLLSIPIAFVGRLADPRPAARRVARRRDPHARSSTRPTTPICRPSSQRDQLVRGQRRARRERLRRRVHRVRHQRLPRPAPERARSRSSSTRSSFLVSARAARLDPATPSQRRRRRPTASRSPRDPPGHRLVAPRPGHPRVRPGLDGAGDAVGRVRGDLDPVRRRRVGPGRRGHRRHRRASADCVVVHRRRVAATRSTRRCGIGPAAIGAMLLSRRSGSALIPLAPASLPLLAFGFLVGQQLIGDSAVTVYDVTETSVRQALVDDRELGRVAVDLPGRGRSGPAAWRRFGAGLLAEVIGLRATSFLAPLGDAPGRRDPVVVAGPQPDELPVTATDGRPPRSRSTWSAISRSGPDRRACHGTGWCWSGGSARLWRTDGSADAARALQLARLGTPDCDEVVSMTMGNGNAERAAPG